MKNLSNKNLSKFGFLIFIPVIVGSGLILGGSSYPMRMAGVCVLFGGSIAVAIIITIITFVVSLRKIKADDKEINVEPEKSTIEDEAERIATVNSTYGMENDLAQAEHQISHIKRAYRHADVSDKVKSGLFLGFLLTDFVMILVFAFIGIYVGSIVCFSLFAGTIVISLILVKIKEHVSMSSKVDKSKFDKKTGTVETCVMSSSMTTNDRIRSITYRVQLNIDGQTYDAYSKKLYDDGETVEVWVKKNGKTVKIIDDDDYSPDLDPELTAEQNTELARACASYKTELKSKLDGCADEQERLELLFRARRDLDGELSGESGGVYFDSEDYNSRLYVKKSLVIADLMREYKVSGKKSRTKKAESEPITQTVDTAAPIINKTPVAAVEPAEPSTASTVIENITPREEVISEEPEVAEHAASDDHPKKPTVGYKGIHNS